MPVQEFRQASDAREQQVQQLQAEIRQANQALIIKQEEITQLNEGAARQVADIASLTKRNRKLGAQAERADVDLDQARVDQIQSRCKVNFRRL